MGKEERLVRREESGAPRGAWLMVFLLGWAWRWSVQGTTAPPPLTVHAVHPANTRQLQTSQLPDHLHSSGFRIVTAL